MRRLGHIAARSAHPLRHCGNAGIDRLQLGLLLVGQMKPGAGEQKFEGCVIDVRLHGYVLLCYAASRIACRPSSAARSPIRAYALTPLGSRPPRPWGSV